MFTFSENFKLGVYATLIFIPIAFWVYEDTKRDLERCHDLNNKIIANQKVISENQQAITERIFRNDPVITPEPKTVKPKNTTQQFTISKTRQRISYERLDIFCLAKNMYHEAGTEGRLGMYAVGQVTLNRMRHKDYPSSVCNVVMQWKQFSWANKKSLRWTHGKGPNWRIAKKIAEEIILDGRRVKGLEGALFYHADYVSPRWKDNDAKIAKLGTHIFYKSAK